MRADGNPPEARSAEGFDPYRYYLAGRGARREPRALPRLAGSAFALAHKASPRLLAFVLVAQVLAAVLLGAQVLLGKAAIEAVLLQSQPGGSFGPVVGPLAGLAFVTAASGLLTGASTHLQRLLAEKLQKLSMEGILGVTTTVELLDFERPEFFNDLQRVRVNAVTRPLTMVTGLVQVVGGSLAVIGLSVSVLLIAPVLLPILLLGGLPLAWLSRRSGQLEFHFAVRETPDRRLRSYLEKVLSDREEAKEIRAFELGDHLRERWEQNSRGYLERLDRHVRRRVRLALASAGVTAVVTGAAFGALTWMIVDGRLELATAGAALIAVRLLSGRISCSSTGQRAVRVEPVPPRPRGVPRRARRRPRARRPATGRRSEECAPTTSRSAIQARTATPSEVSRSASAPARSSPSSGPTAPARRPWPRCSPSCSSRQRDGEWNGVDSRGSIPSACAADRGDLPGLRQLSALARENIGLGRAEAVNDMERVIAAAQRGGAHEHLESLPPGYETLLARSS